MSTDPKSSSGAPPDPSGTAEPTAGQDPKKDTVAYETHQKLLAEKKKRDADFADAQKKLQEYESREKTRQETELKEKEDFKKLLELRDNELKVKSEEFNSLKSSLQNGSKIRALLDQVSGEIPEQYWQLVELDKITIDPSTGMPDPTSVQTYAKEFEKTYPAVVQKKNAGSLPNDAARGGTASLSYDAWLKLPLKEKLARQKDVKT